MAIDHQLNGTSSHQPGDQGPGVKTDFDFWCEAAMRGDFAEAWHINDRTSNHWPSAHRLWTGEAVDDRLLEVSFLHGLGDAVQMLQYAPFLAKKGIRVQFHLPESMGSLLPFFAHAHIPMRTGKEEKICRIEAMELPFYLRTMPNQLPLATNYLQLPARVRRDAARKMGRQQKMRVGLVTSGGTWDKDRWLPDSFARRLVCNTDVEWWNLQPCPRDRTENLSQMHSASHVCGTGLLQLAATISNLDLVVTVDTLAAHLAGSMGIPTCLLLKHRADWRWMSGETTPWYPTLRILRQNVPGAWSTVVDDVTGMLHTTLLNASSVHSVASSAECLSRRDIHATAMMFQGRADQAPREASG